MHSIKTGLHSQNPSVCLELSEFILYNMTHHTSSLCVYFYLQIHTFHSLFLSFYRPTTPTAAAFALQNLASREWCLPGVNIIPVGGSMWEVAEEKSVHTRAD